MQHGAYFGQSEHLCCFHPKIRQKNLQFFLRNNNFQNFECNLPFILGLYINMPVLGKNPKKGQNQQKFSDENEVQKADFLQSWTISKQKSKKLNQITNTENYKKKHKVSQNFPCLLSWGVDQRNCRPAWQKWCWATLPVKGGEAFNESQPLLPISTSSGLASSAKRDSSGRAGPRSSQAGPTKDFRGQEQNRNAMSHRFENETEHREATRWEGGDWAPQNVQQKMPQKDTQPNMQTKSKLKEKKTAAGTQIPSRAPQTVQISLKKIPTFCGIFLLCRTIPNATK